MARIHTLRKAIVIAGLTCCCISDGFIFGQMSGMINALKASNSSLPLTEEDISWIASTINVTCILGYMLMGILAKLVGRRLSTCILSVPVLACWIMLYFVQNKTILLLTRFIVGVSFGGILSLTCLNIGEYISPSVRHIYCNFILCIGGLSGVTLGHIFSLLMDWRIVSLLGLIPSGLACVLPLFWTESPSWLASRGKFNECEMAFRALHGPSKELENEIQSLIEYGKKNQSDCRRNGSKFDSIKIILDACKQWYFWKLTLLLFILNIYRAAAGRILYNTLAITMLQEITGRLDILSFTIIVDGFCIIGAGVSCIFINKFKMRTLLFTSGAISSIMLLLLSASLYYLDSNERDPWIKVILMALYFVIIYAGPYPVLDILVTEVHPLEIKEFSIFVTASLAGVVQFFIIKLEYSLFGSIGYSGTFLLNAIILCLCLIYMWIYMPETKGKTLQEIEVFFRTGKFDNKHKIPYTDACIKNRLLIA